MRDARIMISLEDELQLCKQYLAIESVRLGERLQTDWQITGLSDADIRDTSTCAVIAAVNRKCRALRCRAFVTSCNRFDTFEKSLNKVDVTVKNPQHTPGYAASGNQIALRQYPDRLFFVIRCRGRMISEALNSEFVVNCISRQK
jgi:two-component system sensor histidine kinase AlgZ